MATSSAYDNKGSYVKVNPIDFAEIASKLTGVKALSNSRIQCACPLEGHSTPAKHGSLTDYGDSAAYHCFGNASHNSKALAEYLGYKSLFYAKEKTNQQLPKTEINRDRHPLKLIATHHYRDLNAGGAIFEPYYKERWQSDIPKDKKLYFYHLENGKPLEGRGDNKPVLYRKPDLLKAINNREIIRIVPGEVKVDMLWEYGLAATCWDSGEGSKQVTPDDINLLKGADLIIYQDNDKAGEDYTAYIANSFYAHVHSIKVVVFDELSLHSDVADFIKMGNSKDDLLQREIEAPLYTPTAQPKKDSQRKKDFDWKSEIQSYEQLMGENLPEITFLIENMLTRPGLGVLAAVKKLGKSWFALLLALSISNGENFLGLRTFKTSVAYLALEDGKRRINQRLKLMKAPRTAPINFLYKFPALNSLQGREQFIDMIKQLKPGLIIIDTLAASKNALVDENDNSQMADLMNWFHTVCQDYEMTILIVAHHGKKSTGDAGFDIRGGSAIPGATDVNMGLYKNRETGATNLVIEGRDIPALELTIKFDEGDCRWYLQGETKDIRRQEAEDKIISAIISLGGRGEVLDIARQADVSRSTAQYHLERLRNEHALDYESLLVGKNKILKGFYVFKTKNNTADAVEHCRRTDSEIGQPHGVDAADAVDENTPLDSNYSKDEKEYIEVLQNDEQLFESEQ